MVGVQAGYSRLDRSEGGSIIMTFYPEQKEITEVSTDGPCVHCGKPDWCYRVGELQHIADKWNTFEYKH